MEKTDHTEDCVRFAAKDMFGGIDVELEVHRDEARGYRLGSSSATEDSAELDLWNVPSAALAAPHSVVQVSRLRRVLKRLGGLLKTRR